MKIYVSLSMVQTRGEIEPQGVFHGDIYNIVLSVSANLECSWRSPVGNAPLTPLPAPPM